MERDLEGYRLSPQQERLWRLLRAEPHYRTEGEVWIDGDLKPLRLRAALQRVIDRHEVLRTSFHSHASSGVVLQTIAADAAPEFVESCLGDLPDDAARDAAILRHRSDDLERGFQPESGNLLRAHLFRYGDGRHVLLITAAALAVDARSMQTLMRDLLLEYEALDMGREEQREAPLQYADFAQWQNDVLESDTERDGKLYWEKPELRDRAALRIAFEQAETRRLQLREWTIEDGLLRALDELSQKQDAPLSAILVSCFSALLWRLGGMPERVVLDVGVNGRSHNHLHSALGPFEKFLPLRYRFDEDTSLGGLLRQSVSGLKEAQRWQDFHPANLHAHVEGDVSTERLSFVYHDWAAYARSGVIAFRPRRLSSCAERSKLELHCVRTDGSLTLLLRYDAGIYSDERIDHLQDALTALLMGAAGKWQGPVTELPLLSERARGALLTEWRAAEPPLEVRACIHELFEQQAALSPARVAVVHDDTHITYGDLDRQANQLAHRLRALGVGPDVVVGLLVERSARMLVGLLGIMKAGGAYLPLEPTLPRERRDALIEVAAATIVVTEGELVERDAPFSVLQLDVDASLHGVNAPAVESGVRPEHLAYVIFTSGSTGAPKGVAVEHRHLASYIHGAIERLALDGLHSYATVSTLAADLGNTSVFPALCTGAELHVISRERASDAAALADYFSKHPCDVLKIVPSHLSALVSAASQPNALMPRRRLILGGESLNWGTLRVLRSHAPADCQIYNHYGPTETTVGVIADDTQRHDLTGMTSSVPLGRPMVQARAYVLDARGEPVPVGVPGEVFIGGATVARGYIRRPDLTAERFVTDRLSGQEGARLYRTGDRARRLADGSIEFLGRTDRQIKLRGFRVELGEVEFALRQHATIREAVVVLAGESGYQRLDAYVVSHPGSAPSINALREHAAARLPEYMVPSNWVLLDHMPLTPNGKLDHRALPAPEHIRKGTDTARAAPRTMTEQIISGLFMELLGLSHVGVDDDFFEVGGHSLLATRLLARARAAFQVDISLRTVFESSTVTGLAAAIDTALREADGGDSITDALTPLDVAARAAPLPLSFAQERVWPGRGRDAAIDFQLLLLGPLDTTALARAFDETIRRQEALRTAFSEVDGLPRQCVMAPWALGLHAEALAPGSSREVARAAAQAWTTQGEKPRFDLEHGRPLCARLFRIHPTEHLLAVQLHRLVADDFSRGVLLRELAAQYQAVSEGQPSPLPELVVQYADFAVWQRARLHSAVFERHRAYWASHLDAAPTLELRADRTPPERAEGVTQAHRFTLSPEATQALRAIGRRHSVTLHMLLLATWSMLLREETGQDDIVLSTPMASRNCAETQLLVGRFTDLPLLRADLSGDPSFIALVERLRETVLGAYRHQDLPFDRATMGATLVSSRVGFCVENALEEGPRFGPLQVGALERVCFETAGPDVSLALRNVVTSAGIESTIEYDPQLFERSTAERLARWFGLLVDRVRSDVTAPLSTITTKEFP